MIKFYFAGPYAQRERLLEVAKRLMAIDPENYEVASTGLHGESDDPEEFSAADWVGVVEADVFVMFNEDAYRKESSGGMHTKLGFALAADKEIQVIGPIMRSSKDFGKGINNFTSLHDFHFDTVEDFLNEWSLYVQEGIVEQVKHEILDR
jgi:hypothetical protein